ncbi:MAG: response regulator [Bacteroidota bacterium]|nr:response regulator [Bacteroidota bacterium]
MKKQLGCIMLVDDNPDDNFFHERVIRKNQVANCIISKESAKEALAYLKSETKNDAEQIDIIFLDINMPGMNGWEFLDEYNKLDRALQSEVVIVMLTTSDNPDDRLKATKWNFVSDFKTKPLTKQMLDDILERYFK